MRKRDERYLLELHQDHSGPTHARQVLLRAMRAGVAQKDEGEMSFFEELDIHPEFITLMKSFQHNSSGAVAKTLIEGSKELDKTPEGKELRVMFIFALVCNKDFALCTGLALLEHLSREELLNLISIISESDKITTEGLIRWAKRAGVEKIGS